MHKGVSSGGKEARGAAAPPPLFLALTLVKDL